MPRTRIRRAGVARAAVALAAAGALAVGVVAGAGAAGSAWAGAREPDAGAALLAAGEGTVVVAHRCGEGPENTLPAIEAGIASGADLVEVDVRRSADGVVVLMHDETVDRTTDGTGEVAELTAAELAALDAGGAPVPTLEAALAVLAPVRTGLVVELKGPWDAGQVAGIARLVGAAGLDDRVILASFDLGSLEAARVSAPGLPRLLLTRDLGAVEAVLDRVRPTAVGASLETLARDPAAPGALAGLGIGLFLYTLDAPGEWAEAVAAGARGVITDTPAAAALRLGSASLSDRGGLGP